MSLTLPTSVSIREVGPRDGLQIERPISFEAKCELIERLVASGTKEIEATAFVSPSSVPALADAERVANFVTQWPDITWSALIASKTGLDRALACGMNNVEYVVSASNSHSLSNVKRSTSESVDLLGALVQQCHDAGGKFEIIIATAWDCPFEGPTPANTTIEIVQSAHAVGVDRICVADTIGTATPIRVIEILESVKLLAKGVPVGLHMHNTRGTALASILAAMQVGVTRFDASVGGLGGCPFAPGATGNVATEELVYMCRDMGIDTGIDLASAIEAAAHAQFLMRKELPSGVLRAGDRLRSVAEFS